MEITPTLISAMQIIARVQAALVEAGYNIGTFGPCGDGVDGRWGAATRSGFGAYLAANGYTSGTTEALRGLGVTDISPTTLQNAINAWNVWRKRWVDAGTHGSVAYETACARALAEALPDFVAACTGAPAGAPEIAMTPAATVGAEVGAPKKAEGIPWWVFLLIGVTIIGGGIAAYYWYSKRGARPRRSSERAPAFAAWGAPEIEDEELGESEEGGEGYDGYGEAGGEEGT